MRSTLFLIFERTLLSERCTVYRRQPPRTLHLVSIMHMSACLHVCRFHIYCLLTSVLTSRTTGLLHPPPSSRRALQTLHDDYHRCLPASTDPWCRQSHWRCTARQYYSQHVYYYLCYYDCCLVITSLQFSPPCRLPLL